MNSIKKKALLFVVLFVALAFVSTIPMPMAYETEGGGGVGAWDSATWTGPNPPGATFTGSGTTGGTGSIRYYASGYNNHDPVDGHLKFRKSFTPICSRIYFELDYEWRYYCDARGVQVGVTLRILDGSTYVWMNHVLWKHVMFAGDPPIGTWADSSYIHFDDYAVGHSYTYEVWVSIGRLNNEKSSAGHFCKSSSQLTTASYWNFALSITY